MQCVGGAPRPGHNCCFDTGGPQSVAHARPRAPMLKTEDADGGGWPPRGLLCSQGNRLSGSTCIPCGRHLGGRATPCAGSGHTQRRAGPALGRSRRSQKQPSSVLSWLLGGKGGVWHTVEWCKQAGISARLEAAGWAVCLHSGGRWRCGRVRPQPAPCLSPRTAAPAPATARAPLACPPPPRSPPAPAPWRAEGCLRRRQGQGRAGRAS